MKKRSKIDVLKPDGYKPSKNELAVAWLLAEYFKAKVEVLRPTMGYQEKTPDYCIGELLLELKTPITTKTDKVISIIRSASKQAHVIVIDMRKTKIHEKRMIELCHEGIARYKKVDRISLIVNKHKIFDFGKKV
jgi:hypothetical protein